MGGVRVCVFKLPDFLRYVQCPELKKSSVTSLFHYYRKMCPQVNDRRINYLYVSPQEVGKERLLDGEDNIKFGLIKDHSKTNELMQQIVATFVDTK